MKILFAPVILRKILGVFVFSSKYPPLQTGGTLNFPSQKIQHQHHGRAEVSWGPGRSPKKRVVNSRNSQADWLYRVNRDSFVLPPPPSFHYVGRPRRSSVVLRYCNLTATFFFCLKPPYSVLARLFRLLALTWLCADRNRVVNGRANFSTRLSRLPRSPAAEIHVNFVRTKRVQYDRRGGVRGMIRRKRLNDNRLLFRAFIAVTYTGGHATRKTQISSAPPL